MLTYSDIDYLSKTYDDNGDMVYAPPPKPVESTQHSAQQANGAMPQPVDIPLRVDPSFSAWDSNGDLW